MYLANRYAMAKSAGKVAELATKQGTTGAGISTLSNTAYSDYNSRNYYCKAHMSDDVQRMIDAMNAAGLQTFGAQANDYAAVKLDYIYDTPMGSSGFFALDADIPFYQMVFKGSAGLSGGAINLAQDPKTEFLKTVATGSSLGYTLCDSAERDVLLSIGEAMTGNGILHCTGCRYCTDHCPQGLNIPWLIELYNGYLYSGGKNLPSRTINTLGDDKKPSACVGCKSCEGVCPQQLPISETMTVFAQKLSEG